MYLSRIFLYKRDGTIFIFCFVLKKVKLYNNSPLDFLKYPSVNLISFCCFLKHPHHRRRLMYKLDQRERERENKQTNGRANITQSWKYNAPKYFPTFLSLTFLIFSIFIEYIRLLNRLGRGGRKAETQIYTAKRIF